MKVKFSLLENRTKEREFEIDSLAEQPLTIGNDLGNDIYWHIRSI